jgi:hypothetical protein
MKIATEMIIDEFPMLESELNAYENVLLSNQALEILSEVEQVFLRLAWFFENPDKESFNLDSLYSQLDNDWLEFALEVIYTFFQKDTYLIQNPTSTIITGDDHYLNQSSFANFLKENGLNYDRSKLNVYLSREKTPKPDITISGTKYWKQSTCEAFLKDELQKESD